MNSFLAVLSVAMLPTVIAMSLLNLLQGTALAICLSRAL